jgi:osmoprotectant transport system permease protein
MKEKNRLYWTDITLPLVVVSIGVLYSLYVIFFPMDSMVKDFLTVDLILSRLSQHLYLVAVSSLLAIVTAVPLGIILTRPMFKKFCNFVVGVVNICQTVPGLAVIALFVGVLGIGSKTAIFALWIYSLLPILNNTIAGINGIDPAIIGYAAGMGMTKSHTLTRIEIPLAMPVIMAGIRTAVVINVATTVIAAYVGAGGLGDIIIAGKNINRWQVLVLGAGFSALIALLIDHILGVIERVLTN